MNDLDWVKASELNTTKQNTIPWQGALSISQYHKLRYHLIWETKAPYIRACGGTGWLVNMPLLHI